MKMRYLGNSGVKVSELCFGAMTFGGKGRWKAIGELEQKDANELIKLALMVELISLIRPMFIQKAWLKKCWVKH